MVVQKLENIRPDSVGQASRIEGITPAAISLLLVHLKKKRLLRVRSLLVVLIVLMITFMLNAETCWRRVCLI